MFNSNPEFIQLLNLGTDSEAELAAMKDKRIEFRKSLGKLLNKSRKDAKSGKCYICGENCSSFCNSHSIPAFFLRNIAVDGEVFNNNKLVNLPLLDDEKGVNQSGTFHIICNDCDSKIFRDYENPDNYEDEPSIKMIGQIAMKNYLKNISKRKVEIALYDNMYSNLGLPKHIYNQRQEINKLDLKEYDEGFNRAKRIETKGWENEYYLFYYQKLDYVVPVAFQSSLALVIDFEGTIINDIYNTSPNYKIQDVHICVFPLEKSSVIMMFVDSKNKRYRSFYKQFKKLKLNDKLAAINYIIFSYSEDVFINKKVSVEVLKHKGLIDVSRNSFDILSTTLNFDTSAVIRENLDFSKMNAIPNLLLEEYKVNITRSVQQTSI